LKRLSKLKPNNKKMNTENKRIPFDWDKYQSGEYEAVCRDGEKPEQLTHNPNAIEANKIAMWVKGQLYSNRINGLLWSEGEMPYDIFLIPKPKKFQAWVNLYDNGYCTSYKNESDAELLKKRYEGESVKCVETRLIEWEG
jgi:hypothetical protein